jgi:4-amino-4-deoxy-L-arabinose transferase-like glycosyltransferase
LALVLIWALPAQLQTDWAYFEVGIGKHVVERGTGAMNDRFFIPGLYYLFIVIPFLLPWSPQLPATLKKSGRASSLDTRFLLGWLVAPFLVFSFYATQLPHYILPGYPAFFLLLALSYREGIALGRFGKIIRALALAIPDLWVCRPSFQQQLHTSTTPTPPSARRLGAPAALQKNVQRSVAAHTLLRIGICTCEMQGHEGGRGCECIFVGAYANSFTF